MSRHCVAYSIAYDIALYRRRARKLAREIAESLDRADVCAEVHYLVRDVEEVANSAIALARELDDPSCGYPFSHARRHTRILTDDLGQDLNLIENRAAAIAHMRGLASALRLGKHSALRLARASIAETGTGATGRWARSPGARLLAQRVLSAGARLLPP